MRTKHGFFTDQYGISLYLYQWLPDGKPQEILQVIHGMAEHDSRYERLVRYLTDRDIAVFADDHRGHGLTVSGGK